MRGHNDSAGRRELRGRRIAPNPRRNVPRLRSTAARESSFVKPRLSSLLPYARETPPTRVEKPCTSHETSFNCIARRMFSLVLPIVFEAAPVATIPMLQEFELRSE